MAIYEGTPGNDTLLGGEGDDVLRDVRGNDSIDGGGGNDLIEIIRTDRNTSGDLLERITLTGGAGDDTVHVDVKDTGWSMGAYRAALVIDLGPGNDRLFLAEGYVSGTATLGAGADRIELGGDYSLRGNFQTIVISDFQAGPGGDVLDLGSVLLASEWNQVTNPFATGHLRLFQQGPDTIVSRDYDGVDGYPETGALFRLRNVDASTLTAANFTGWAPDRSAPVPVVGGGTAGDDFLAGSPAADSIAGLEGNDRLEGGFGNDTLDGGDGDDTLIGGRGADRLLGGAGNDYIEDRATALDTISGGDGNDRIVVQDVYTSGTAPPVAIDAGAGDDDVDVMTDQGSLQVTLGDGNDRVLLRSYPDGGASISLGAGADVVAFDPALTLYSNEAFVITDFQAGDGGDRIDWLGYAADFAGVAEAGFNPFAANYARLAQSGADTVLQMRQGTSFWSTWLTLKNTTLASLADYNFGVEIHALPPLPEPDTHTGTANADSLSGTAGRDVMSGLAGNDTLVGLEGNDWLRGGAGNDRADGGEGDDTLDDTTGTDTLLGGAGNDAFNVTITGNVLGGNTDAGDGNDALAISGESSSSTPYPAAMGAGDDIVSVGYAYTPIQLTLGDGADRVVLTAGYKPSSSARLVINDFQAGDGGDVLDLSAYLATWMGSYAQASPGKSVFELGAYRLAQVGANVELITVANALQGGSGTTYIRFANTTLGQFTAHNFGGIDPHASGNGSIGVTGALTIEAGRTEAVVNTTQSAYWRAHYLLSNSSAQLTNHGTILTESTTQGTATVGVNMVESGGAGASFFNAGDGVFTVRSHYAGEFSVSSIGVRAGNVGLDFRNDGAFDVRTADGVATGVSFPAGSNSERTAVNNGTMVVVAPEQAIGADLGSSATFTNKGSLLVTSARAAVGIRIDSDSTRPIVNNGVITVDAGPDAAAVAIGVLVKEEGSPFAQSYTHTNTGTVTAGFAWFVDEPDDVGFTDTLTNSGQINGLVLLGRGNDVINNAGGMSGRTLLGEGNDAYAGAAGTHTGTVEGGTGNDTLQGGAGPEQLQGDGGADSLSGGEGNDTLAGGSGNDTLAGGGGIDTVSYLRSLQPVTVDLTAATGGGRGEADALSGFERAIGSRAGDTLLGSGAADTLYGFHGADAIDGRAGDDALVGGRGADTLTGGAGNDRFQFDAGDGIDRIADFAAGDLIEVSGHTAALSIAQEGAAVRVTLSETDAIVVANADVATVQAALSFSATPFGVTAPGLESEALESDAHLGIGEGAQFVLGDTGGAAGDMLGLATYDVLPASTALFMHAGTGLWNAGTLAIGTTASGATTFGVTPLPGSSGINQLVNHATGTIRVTAASSDATGVNALDGVWNRGLIEVTSATGNATGVDNIPGQDASFVNSGTILVDAALSGLGASLDGAWSNAGGQFFNSGRVDVHGGAASVGLQLVQDRTNYSSVVNSGTIEVTDETAILDSVGISLDVRTRNEVFNSGTIRADFAIRAGESDDGHDFTPYALGVFNTGTIEGAIAMSGSNDRLVNTGTITGRVSLGAGNDRFDGRGGTLNGVLEGYDGYDTLLGGANADIMSGGFGRDVLAGGGGNDTLEGGADVDSFRFGSGGGRDVIVDYESGPTRDNIWIENYFSYQSITQTADGVLLVFSASDSLLVRGATVSALTAPGAILFGVIPMAATEVPATPGAPAEPPEPGVIPAGWITGTEGNDTLTGDAIANRIDGLGGADSMDGAEGDDTLLGGAGNDTLTGGAGNDSIEGGSGRDTLLVKGSAAVNVNLVTFIMTGEGTDTLRDIEYVTGGSGNDVIVGNIQWNRLDGGDGDDTIEPVPSIAADTIIGGAGIDTITYANVDVSITVELANGYVGAQANNSVSGVENVIGGTGWDRITGDANANLLSGGFGEDTLEGGAGHDTLLGGDAYDTLTGGTGNDSIDGGGFDDVAIYTGTYAQYSVGYDAATGRLVVADTVAGRDGVDSVTNVESFRFSDGTRTAAELRNWGVGTAGDDLRSGTSAGDSLNGMAGNDTLNGLDGDDTLVGGFGNDSLSGGAGNDRLEGGGGIDFMSGGAGDDSLHTQGGSDTVDGAAGSDVAYLPLALSNYTVIARSASEVVVRHVPSFETITLRGIEFVAGGSDAPVPIADLYANVITEQDDLWTGTAGNDSQSGLGGHDSMDGAAGNDTLLGATGNDTLTGGDGNDRLDGGAGNDVMTGGAGDDVYVLDTVFDVIAPSDPGMDTAEVYLLVATTFVMPVGLEAATLYPQGSVPIHITGNDGDNAITGNTVANSLSGAGGHDTLDGGAGNDTMVGGAGNDTYLVSAAGDIVTEALDGGIDTADVQFAGTWLMGANVENARIVSATGGGITGNALANDILGNAGANSLAGGDGNDTLRGGGGNDTLDGGAGSADVVALSDARGQYSVARPGTAEVLLTHIPTGQVTRVLNTEIFRFTDGDRSFAEMIVNTVSPFGDVWTGTGANDTIDGGAGDDSLSGLAGNDTLAGNTGNDTLVGGAGNDNLNGGAGNDSMLGGEGDDTYTVDAAADAIVESPSQGVDLVNVALASGTYSMLVSAPEVENATVVSTAAVNVTGNNLDNTIVGNAASNNLQGGEGKDALAGGAGNDTLIGGNGDDTLNGGAGTDSMTGGAGNDTYVVSATADIVSETGVGDFDTVLVEFTAAGAYTLGANIEGGVILGSLGGINITGNALANDIRGNSGNNVLSGGAGGNDTLSGGGGNDTIDGGTETDTLVLAGNASDYAITRPSATQTIFSQAGTQVTVTNVEMVRFDGGTVTLASLLRTVGSTGNDSLVGNATAETFDGGAGNDTLLAGAGDDTLAGGAGNDLLVGGAGSDQLDGGAGSDTYTFDMATLDESDDYIAQGDTVAGSVDTVSIVTAGAVSYSRGDQSYDDLVIQVVEGAEGLETVRRIVIQNFFDNDAVSAGTIDRVLLGATIVTATQVAAQAQVMGDGESVFVGVGSNDTLAGNDADNWMLAGAGNDSVQGGAGSDTLFGGAGADTLSGGVGDDRISGGSNSDQLAGGLGNDTLAGGAGGDTYTWRAGDGADTVVERGLPFKSADLDSGIGPVYVPGDGDASAAPDNDVLVMQGISQASVQVTRSGDDLLLLHAASGGSVRVEGFFASGVSTIERITFSDANWSATSVRAKALVPTAGNDAITGYLGADRLSGLAGADTLSGMGGNDVLMGGAGADVLWGGSGSDRFVLDVFDGSVDTVMDFASGDTLAISAAAAAFTGTGRPTPGSRAGTGSAYVSYDAQTGELWLDRDGAGSAAAPVLVAVLGVDSHPALANVLIVA